MWFQYTQNNSGGFFTNPAIYVLVEAANAEKADAIAETEGVYFDGAGDCPCCGNRWSNAYGKGNREPHIYETSLLKTYPIKDFDDYLHDRATFLKLVPLKGQAKTFSLTDARTGVVAKWLKKRSKKS